MKLGLRQIKLPLADFTLALDLTVEARVLGLCGPSGAGKTSLLDLIAGLRRPRSATIQIDELIMEDTARGISLPARLRGVGYVPQDLALFPHLSVTGNLRYGLRENVALASKFKFEHVTEVLDIRPLLTRRIASLSGGERQRVALGRALLSAPRVLLLDEPLAGLEAGLRSRIVTYLQLVRDEFEVPMLYVSHNPDEMRALCDATVELERGQRVAVRS